MLTGTEGLIFAAGVDDRVVPKAPAWEFFRRGNVEATRRIVRFARQAGLGHMVVFSSYFVAFNRLWPLLKMAETHPYLSSRVAQIEAAKDEAGKSSAI
jgi:nucleoside-diphosphate-sugar epimerase